MVEQFNGMLKEMTKIACINKRRWDKKIAFFLFAYCDSLMQPLFIPLRAHVWPKRTGIPHINVRSLDGKGINQTIGAATCHVDTESTHRILPSG